MESDKYPNKEKAIPMWLNHADIHNRARGKNYKNLKNWENKKK